MRKLALVSIFVLLIPFAVNGADRVSDDYIKQQIIQQSIASYPGSCPCPYNLARNGSQCGARSAYSKPGGYDPICYPRDVTPEMIQQYRRRTGT